MRTDGIVVPSDQGAGWPQGLASRGFSRSRSLTTSERRRKPPAGPHGTGDTFWQAMHRTPKGRRDMHRGRQSPAEQGGPRRHE